MEYVGEARQCWTRGVHRRVPPACTSSPGDLDRLWCLAIYVQNTAIHDCLSDLYGLETQLTALLCTVPSQGRGPWTAELNPFYPQISKLCKKTAIRPELETLTHAVRTAAAVYHLVYHNLADDNYSSYPARWTWNGYRKDAGSAVLFAIGRCMSPAKRSYPSPNVHMAAAAIHEQSRQCHLNSL